MQEPKMEKLFTRIEKTKREDLFLSFCAISYIFIALLFNI